MKKKSTCNSARGTLTVLGGLALGAALAVSGFLIGSPKSVTSSASAFTEMTSEVNAICELATIRAYYHNVSEFEKEPDGLFKYGLFQYGYKKMWMEYSGTVTVGIDVNEVKVRKSDEKNVIEIFVPDAKILDVSADKSTLTKPLMDTGVLTEISVADEAQAFSEAQAAMEEEANANTSLLAQARNRAKELLKEYILNTGKQMGTDYTIKWVES